MIRVGVCSWADETLTKVWYPRGVTGGEERLTYYAERFDVVEANSTYYRLPAPEQVENWARWTPDDFLMHVKAYGTMTRHPVKLETLPPDLRDVETDERGRVDRPPREFRARVFERFRELLEPLRARGKLGGILLQFPPYVVYRPESLEYLEWAQEQLPGEDVLVEFRHVSWLSEENRAATLAFLEARGLTHVIVDAPRSEARNLSPTVVAATTPTAYVRFHGRNAATWNIRSKSAAERFDWLYSEEELAEWVEPLRELAGRAENVYAMFNNNGRTATPSVERIGEDEWIAQAPASAELLRGLLEAAGLPVSRP